MAHDAIFEALARRSLYVDTAEATVRSLDEGVLREVVLECYHAIDEASGKPTFSDLVTNERLAGGPVPCSAVGCRTAAASQLARFSTLYTTRTWIPNPFERYLHNICSPADEHSSETLSNRWTLIGDIIILHLLRPLLHNNIIDFVRPPHYCAEHWLESGEQTVIEALRKAAVDIADKYRRAINVFVKKIDDIYHVEITGPDDLVPGGHRGMVYGGVPDHIAKLAGAERIQLTPADVESGQFLSMTALAEARDIHIQSFHSRKTGCASLVDRGLDALVLGAVETDHKVERARALLEGFSHVLPELEDATVEQLINLRLNEGEAFLVYRDSIQRALSEIEKTQDTGEKGAAAVRSVFRDVVQPELNKIDKAVRGFRRAALAKSAKGVLLAGTAITVGLFSGLPGAIGNLIATFGGTRGLYDAAKESLGAAGEPEAARSSDYYFLWRARKL